jgi:type I restriction enzyme S subunit
VFKVGEISRAATAGEVFLRASGHYLSESHRKQLGGRVIPQGATVFAKVGAAIALDRRAIVAQDSLVDNNVMAVWSSQLDNRFVFRFMQTVRLGELSQATAIPSIRKSDVVRIPVPIPPPDEQRRIVDAIDELFSDLDAGEAALRDARRKLDRYRQSVLNAAVTGALTEAWREAHPDVEPASKLLARVLEGSTPRPKRRIEPPAAHVAPLPESWIWTQVYEVGDVQLGRQRSPQHHTGEHMRPYLRVANVYEARIDTRDVKEMNFTPAEFETFKLTPGDILLNEGQSPELVGRPAMYNGEVEGACFQNTLVRFRAMPALDRRYALIYFLACLHNGRFRRLASQTVNIAHLGAGRFAEMEFPLPPLAEQATIVEEVERRLSVADAVAADVDAQLARSKRLRRSILQRAFEGRLVPRVSDFTSAEATRPTAPTARPPADAQTALDLH